VRIGDPTTGARLPPGEVGSIEVRGPNVFRGYWRAPDKTAAEFRADGFFITGDLGAFDTEGYLSIVGRSRDVVITGGLNVYPAEVEGAIDALPGVAASAVIGVPHPDFGEAVVAVVVPATGAALGEEALRDALRERLAGFKIPKRVILASDLPRNAMGKVQKNVLRQLHASLFAPD
jgi:malonyl-CoA/methylmalonyl-CoA synthetase